MVAKILCVLNALKLFYMEASAMGTDSAITFPIVWVRGAAQLESFWHATSGVFECIG